MFIQRSARELNLRVVYFGPSLAGKGQALRYIHDRLGPDGRGRLITAESGGDRTVFFDFSPASLGKIHGFRVRLHLYTLTGLVHSAAAHERILRGADGVMLVADAQRARLEANVQAYTQLTEALEVHGRALADVPLVVQLNKADLPGAVGADALREALGLPAEVPVVAADAVHGAGVFEALKAMTKALLLALRDDRLRETTLDDDARREAAEFMARARVVGHYGEHLGETLAEYDAAQRPSGLPRVIVVEHGPLPTRPYWTYATAGLSLRAQPAEGPEPHLELLAYAPRRDQRVADVLMAVAHQIGASAPDEPPYKTFDTLDLTGMPLVHPTFVLAPAAESSALLDFPSTSPDDLRYTALMGDVRVRFVQVRPVSARELDEANREGTPALLRRLDASGARVDAGWPTG